MSRDVLVARFECHFEGKRAQLCSLLKSTIFIVGISNFGIVPFKRYIFIVHGKHFRFIGTLISAITIDLQAQIEILGAFHSTKYSGLKFRVFHATNGTVFSGALD